MRELPALKRFSYPRLFVSLCVGLLFITNAALGDGPKVPRALAWAGDGSLMVANRDGKSLLRVDLTSRKVVAEYPVGARLASIATDPSSGDWLCGSDAGELLVISADGRVRSRKRWGQGPSAVVSLPQGRVLFTSRWDRSVRVIDLGKNVQIGVHALPFSPGVALRVGDNAVVVADAFGGNLAVLRLGQPELDRVVPFDGFALRGLATADDGKTLLIAHVKAFGTMPITKSNIDWGLVLSSKLTALSTRDLLASDGKTPVPMHRIALDGSRNGAADPVAVAATPNNQYLLVAASGARHLLIQDRDEGGPGPDDGLPRLGNASMTRVVETGENPSAIAITPDGKLAITADAMGDTLTIVDIVNASRVGTIRIGPGARAGSPVQRGEALFADGGRSLDRWMSCATCHVDGHTVGLRFDTLGDGDHGDPKDTPSLLGIGTTAPYAWTGRFARLEEQIFQSFDSSMQGATPSPDELADLSAYLRSLTTPPPVEQPATPLVERGRALFSSRQCTKCHQPPTYSSTKKVDVGLSDENQRHEFNPPSLRGVGWSAPYFHDGRATSLEAVVKTHSPASDDPLDEAQVQALVAFLRSL